MRSGNPVFPYEWTVRYADGTSFPRVMAGIARTSRSAPLHGVTELHITGPDVRFDIPRPRDPILNLVLRATIEGRLDTGPQRVLCWMFGFQTADAIHGIVVHPDGRVTDPMW